MLVTHFLSPSVLAKVSGCDGRVSYDLGLEAHSIIFEASFESETRP